MEDNNKSEDCQRVRKAEDTLEIDQPKPKKTRNDDECVLEKSSEPIKYIKHKYNGSVFQLPIKVNESECPVIQLGKNRYQRSSTEQITAIYFQLSEKRKVKL